MPIIAITGNDIRISMTCQGKFQGVKVFLLIILQLFLQIFYPFSPRKGPRGGERGLQTVPNRNYRRYVASPQSHSGNIMKDTKKIMVMVTISRELFSREDRYECKKRLCERRISLARLQRAHRLEVEVDVHGGWSRAARNEHTGRPFEFQLPAGLQQDGTPAMVPDGQVRISTAGVVVPSQTEESTPKTLFMKGTPKCHRQQ